MTKYLFIALLIATTAVAGVSLRITKVSSLIKGLDSVKITLQYRDSLQVDWKDVPTLKDDWDEGRITYREYLDKRLWLRSIEVDTVGTLYDQWCWGSITYREYLDRRLGRPYTQWQSVDTFYSTRQGWYECSLRSIVIDISQTWTDFDTNRDWYLPPQPKGFPLWLDLFWRAYSWLS